MPPKEPWRFLQIEPALHPGPGYDQLMRQLQVASMTVGKVWVLWRPLTVVGVALALAALGGVFLRWIRAEDRTLVTLYGLRSLLLVTLLALLVPTLVRFVRYRQTFRKLGLRALGAALLSLVFIIHLLLFDPLFIRLGRVRRFRAMRKAA